MIRSCALVALAVAAIGLGSVSPADARGFGRDGGFHGGGFHGGGFHGGGFHGGGFQNRGFHGTGFRGLGFRSGDDGSMAVMRSRARFGSTVVDQGGQRVCMHRHWVFDAYGNPVRWTYMCR